MINQFDTDNYPTKEPKSVVVGTLFNWKRPDITDAYGTTDYNLEYRFSLQSETVTAITINAGKIDSAFVVQESQSVTSNYKDGFYFWQAVIVRISDSEEVLVDSGYMEFTPDASVSDTRSHNYITLKNIRATIQGTATKDQSSYSVAGRSLSRRSIDELLKLEETYLRRWNSELAAKDGRSNVSTVLIKMGS
tara:strand:- start:2806 stop:3381 length:576 start_codon:yes stop_codon:yes gene_type:complete